LERYAIFRIRSKRLGMSCSTASCTHCPIVRRAALWVFLRRQFATLLQTCVYKCLPDRVTSACHSSIRPTARFYVEILIQRNYYGNNASQRSLFDRISYQVYNAHYIPNISLYRGVDGHPWWSLSQIPIVILCAVRLCVYVCSTVYCIVRQLISRPILLTRLLLFTPVCYRHGYYKPH